MSVQLNPAVQLGFNRPLTQTVKRNLSVTNNNAHPVAFKVKTTAPKLYCVRPNSGRIEPGETVHVQVLLQPMKEEPPLSAKCKDKFLVQSTFITPSREHLSLNDIWVEDGQEESKIHQQKIRVAYLPPEGTVEEEEYEHPSRFTHEGDSRYDTVRQHPMGNGHSSYTQPPLNPMPAPQIPVYPDDTHHRAPSPAPRPPSPARYPEHDDPHPDEHFEVAPADVPSHSHPPVHAPRTPPSPPAVQTYHAQTSQTLSSEAYQALDAKYSEAQAEIMRLRGLLAAQPDQNATVRQRRNKALSDDGSIAHTEAPDDRELAETGLAHPEGVPLQVVIIIALGVFVTTYLFF